MKKRKKRLHAAIVSAVMTAAVAAVPFTGMTEAKIVSAADYDNYAKLLQYSLYFYDANMCGSGVNSNSQINWRSNCHTQDEVDFGFHDAGDHVKFGLPQGYAASTLGWGYYEFKDSYDSLGLTSHYKTISDYFCKFFKASTKLNGNTVSSFCYQIGDGDQDHAEWCAPEKQNGSRKALWTNSEGSDIAAEYAAALALSYINFGNTEDLTYAKALYAYAKQVNRVASTGIGSFYESTSFTDDLAWAAGWLYKATNDESYKNDCASYQSQYLGWVHSWNTADLGAACVYAEITGDWSKVHDYINTLANGDGYMFLNKWGSARYNTSLQFTALVSDKHSNSNYASWCQKQMTYILGQNPANTCFVVGFASNSAKNYHHRAASGYNSYDEMGNNKQHSPNGHTLVGALVGGPIDANGTYNDVIDDYEGNEVALDYNAGLVGAAAGLYSVYKTGSVEKSIEGVTNVVVEPVNTEPAVTTAPPVVTAAPPQTTKTPSPSTNGSYEYKPNQNITCSQLPENDKMVGWKWSEFGIPAGEKITKVEVNISSSKNIGKWEGAFGSSTTKSPDYWTQTSDMSQTISGNSGTITWNIDSATSEIIQRNYNGELKMGTWWIDCDSFTVDSIKVTTDAAGSSVVTTAPPVVTAAPPQTTKTPSPSTNGSYEYKPNQNITCSQLPENDKMVGWKWSEFGIPAGEKVKKVEINISSSKNIGKWQGAFGSSTTKSPDYWTQTSDMSQTISGNSGTITWNVDSATSDIIQLNYNGELKMGTWWIDCDSFTVDSIKVTTDGSGTPAVTTAPPVVTAAPPQTTKTPSPSGGGYEYKPNQNVTCSQLPEDDKMIGWKWSEFGIPAGEKVKKVEINISSSKNIGKWEGAFGSSTTKSPDYWTQTSDMSQTISGNSGTITWNVDSATSDIIQLNYNGELKFGIWWIDCDSFKIDSIKVTTDGSGTPAVTTKTTTANTTKATEGSINQNVTAKLKGDVTNDGEVDIRDITALNQYLVGIVKLDEQQLANANVINDTAVDVKDLGQLKKYIVKLITSF